MQLVIHNLCKAFGEQQVLKNISLQVEAGQLACLLGASGCGKTTLLRCVAGFEGIDDGAISLDQTMVSQSVLHIPPQQRSVGMVFQDHALFPHLTVAQNAAFGLHRMNRVDRRARVAHVLQLVGLASMGERYPRALSGGQQQRAALARALAIQPRLLLLDEPFANLDRDLRYRLAQEVAQILKVSGTTALWVTHDQQEAMMVADVVGVMNHGEIEQWAAPAALYYRPVSRFVAGFLGECRFIDGVIDAQGKIATALGPVAQQDGQCLPPGTPVDVLVRPEQLNSGDGVRATLVQTRFQGAATLCEVVLDSGEQLLMLAASRTLPRTGDVVRLRWGDTTAPAYKK